MKTQHLIAGAALTRALRRAALSAAIASSFAWATLTLAFEIPTGNYDLVVRCDDTFRYNLGMRAQGQDQSILANRIWMTATATSRTVRW